MRNLSEWVRTFNRRPVIPLAGAPGIQLTATTLKQNEFNGELQARSIAALVEKTHPDAALPLMDLSILANAIGLLVDYPLERIATVLPHTIHSTEDIQIFRRIDPLRDGRVIANCEAIERLSRSLEIPVGAYVCAPFTLAALMMGAEDCNVALLLNPDLASEVVKFTTGIIIRYARELVKSGAEFLIMLDPTAVLLSPELYREFAAKPVARVIERADVPCILHVCGDTNHIIEEMCRTGAQGVSLDTPVSLPEIAGKIPGDITILGNLDPISVMWQGTPDSVREAARELLNAMATFPNFILSSGCDIPAETPIENIQALVSEVNSLAIAGANE